MEDNKKITNEKYHENVVKTWSHGAYSKYQGSSWRWADLPFRDNIIKGDYSFKEYLNQTLSLKLKEKRILEVGSAMGSAYEFIKNSGLIDLKNYTGIEVSKVGIDYCKQNHPEANWMHQDFTKLEKLDECDYAFERNAIHHMPDPNKQYDKILKSTKIAFSTCFRSCLKGSTISDLTLSNFTTATGTYYSSIINLFDLIEMGIQHGFGNIKVTFGGPHEIISNDPKATHYIDPSINQKEIFLSRCKVFMVKTDFKKQPLITFVARPDVALKNIKAMILINSELKKIKKKYAK
ncbi:class I SAM-dependent methyltransferase [Flavobacteriaceae bacterium]|nr:class I SAM-dependent methyltransferase [Flavobacteriaceae bacterium]